MIIDTGPAPLQATARWTAAVRAGERRRPDALVDDPWAEALAGEEGMAWLAARPPESVTPIAIRARYFDDWLRTVVIDGGLRQVVLLAAGLDTRAWRLPWAPGTTVFELDRGALLAAKDGIMAAAGAPGPDARRVTVDADLAGDWAGALEAAGFDVGRPAAWLAEGILFYLPDDAVAGVLRAVTRLAAPGSQVGFDIPNGAVLTSPYTKAWLDMQAAAGAPWVGTLEDPAAVLDGLGWTATIAQPGEPVANHGRWTLPVIPAAMRELPHTWYATAVRR
jgi:methyltransferase (TIGR00027 family)